MAEGLEEHVSPGPLGPLGYGRGYASVLCTKQGMPVPWLWYVSCLDDPDNDRDRQMIVHLQRLVYMQLPEGIRDQFKIVIDADAFCLSVKATFIDPKGNEWVTKLEPEAIKFDDERAGFIEASIKVPESFIAQLCVVV